MVKHLFTLIWNKKKQNFLVMLEILVSFLVMFAVFSLNVNDYKRYKKPMGLESEDVWVINYNNSVQISSKDSLMRYYETLRQLVKGLPFVKEMSFSSDNVPFSQTTNGSGVFYEKNEVQSDLFMVEDTYQNLLGIKILEGHWFGFQDVVSKNNAVVINAALKEKLFGAESAIGKEVSFSYDKKTKNKVIGVVQDAKVKGDYSLVSPAIYNRIDTGSIDRIGNILIKVSHDADAAFEGRLYKLLANYMKNADVEIEHLVNKRTSINRFTLIPMIALLLVGGFLIINVALGLFGVLWYNINKRRGEIGLRRAIGASGTAVSGQLVSEAMIIATLSLIAGTFFAVQFPLLNVFDLPTQVYFLAILFSIIFIYLLVLICSLYPGRQAAAIYPAVALHED
jgi:putative ABC transport system permease protein